MDRISKISSFFKKDLWRIRKGDLPPFRYRLLGTIRIFMAALKGFGQDRLQLRASALTFYSLLSIVPVAGMIFGIAKGFGFKDMLETELMQKLEGHEEIVARVIEFSQALLENTKGGLIAGVGMVILFWTVIKVLSNIENSFNHIWGVTKPRSIGRKVSDYLSLMLICPILLVMSSSVTVMITSQAELILNKVALLGVVAPVIMFVLKALPYCVIWLLFSFIYVFMPNTKVHFSSGILAGVIAGTMFQAFEWVYISFQINVAKYNAIYGSFAAIPLFLFWLQISWLIVLFGAEVCFAHQNVETYEFEEECGSISERFKRLMALGIVKLLIKNFSAGKEVWTESRISKELEIPIHCTRQVVSELVEAGIISEVSTRDDREMGLQPAMDTDSLTIKYVLDRLSNHGVDDIPIARTRDFEKISECLDEFGEILSKAPSNMRLKDV